MNEGIKPTRMELLNCKQQLAMAEKGHEILKQKRDALVMEFMKTIKKAKNLRGEVNSETVAAHRKLAVARSTHGDLFVEASAMQSNAIPGVNVRPKNIMGVSIPLIEAVNVKRNLLERGYSVHGSTAAFDEATTAFENTLQKIVYLAETETSIKRLLAEIEQTNRRVNALEYNIQPALRQTIRHISDHLNRLESERFFALKLTKARIENAEKEAQEAGS
ncbi:TPA: V-type ATP synthase subunit D [Candidatus Micrarchaeota archaeon]|nr:V-type ATP synthase subunit D [Candidatus Micrarchaeota archaeon]